MRLGVSAGWIILLVLLAGCSASDDGAASPAGPMSERMVSERSGDRGYCDHELRRLLGHLPPAFADVEGANAVVFIVQAAEAEDCGGWSRELAQYTRDGSGNIYAMLSDVDGEAPWWVYVAAEERWYAAEEGHPALSEVSQAKAVAPTPADVQGRGAPTTGSTAVDERGVLEEAYASCDGYYRGVELRLRREMARLKSLAGLADAVRRHCEGAVAAAASRLGVTPLPTPTWPPTAAPLPTWTPEPTVTPTPLPRRAPAEPVWAGLLPPGRFEGRPLPASSRGSETLNASVIERFVLQYTNQERERHGLPALQNDGAISAIARGHSENMMRQGVYRHTLDSLDANGRGVVAGFSCRHYFADGSFAPSSGLAENIHRVHQVDSWTIIDGVIWRPNRVYGSQELAEQLVRDWMNSPGHRGNILSPTYGRIGVGIAVGPHVERGLPWQSVWATQNFSTCR